MRKSKHPIVRLGDIVEVSPRTPRMPSDMDVSFLGMADVSEDGKILNNNIRKYIEVSKGYTPFRDGDILVAKITPCFENGKGALVHSLANGIGFGSTEFHVLRPTEQIDPYLLLSITQSKPFRVLGESEMSGSAGQKRVPSSFIADYEIPLPPLPEQRKIAAILRTWDEAIEKLEKLKQQRKKLFHQRRRQLTDITSGHGVKFKLLSEISKVINRRNDDYDAPVMMISSTQGFIRQDANYDREMAGESLKKYIYLKEGEFAYNKGNSKTYPYGCIFRLEVPHALIPFVYICFKLDDNLNAGYFRHYFEAGSINRQLVRLISSSVRGNGLLNIDADDFFSCRIPVPDRSYQDTCASFLDAATKELAVLDAEISFIKNQKRGLMQKLLTGAWRVQVDESNNTQAEKISCS